MVNISLTYTAKRVILFLSFFQLASFAAISQVKFHAKDNLQLVISGTSTLHDWTMKSTKADCNATLTLNSAGQPAGLTALSFSLPAESLKSDHTAMDKNAYKALKTEQFPSITYKLSSATVESDGSIKCLGKLTIAGATLETDVLATAKLNADQSITISGSKKISMKDFKISPPTFMLGTVKTGNDIVVKYNLTLIK
ncbi:MAG TPA: YceI family protein [Pedobacter sp.]